MIAVAKESIRSHRTTPLREDKQHPSRINAAAIRAAELDNLSVEDLAARYDCTEGHAIIAWLDTLCDVNQPTRSLSWFQLNALFEYQTKSTGVKYNKSRKQWENGNMQQKARDFVARSNGLSRWVQGVAAAQQRHCQPVHLRPDSGVIQFWTMCLPLQIKPELAILADDILRNSAPALRTVKSLRSL